MSIDFDSLKKNLCEKIMAFDPTQCNAVSHVLTELSYIKSDDEESNGMQMMMNESLLELVIVFSTQGHSGFSASYARNILDKLLAFKPITPLTGEDSEWVDVAEHDGVTVYQNKRCSTVFKEGDQVYNSEGRVFVEDGCGFINIDSRVAITFPYTPKTEYVYREKN